MIFTRRLRDGVRRGEITCSVRIWMRPHVKVGHRYDMEEGEIEVDSVLPKVAKHGKGENVYLVRFHYVPPRGRLSAARRPARRRA